MSRTVKIILGIGGFFLIVCCGIAAVVTFVVPSAVERIADSSFSESPEEAAAVGQTMLNYTLPNGFQEVSAMQLGIKMVFIESNSDMGIIIMEFPDFLMDEDEMINEMQRTASDQIGSGELTVESTTTEQIVINGDTVTLTTIVGTDENDRQMRQMIAPFASNDGGAGVLMIMVSEENWNGDAAGTFLNSLR